MLFLVFRCIKTSLLYVTILTSISGALKKKKKKGRKERKKFMRLFSDGKSILSELL